MELFNNTFIFVVVAIIIIILISIQYTLNKILIILREIKDFKNKNNDIKK